MKPIIPINQALTLPKYSNIFLLFICMQCFMLQTLQAQEHNRVETFTTANGLASLGCSDVLREPDGTVWVTHKDYYQAPFVYGQPISRRNINGTWDYPSLSSLPSITVGGNSYPNAFSFDKMFRTSDGKIWFLSSKSVPFNEDGNVAPPLVVYDNGNFSMYHSSLNNFPNKGGVIDMTEDDDNNLWFACSGGLVKMSNAGVFSTYNPPNAQYTTNSNQQVNIPAKRVISVDIDNNNNVVMVVDGQFNYVRRYRPVDNQWDLWTLMDAPWVNAGQTTYAPLEIKALHDKKNTIWITTYGGGLYYIENNDYNSNERTQIANFLVPPIWGTWGWAMDIIRTNLPDFNTRLFNDNLNETWILGSPGSTGIDYVYKLQSITHATYLYNNQNVPATRYNFSRRGTQFTYNNNGTQSASSITGMSFAAGNTEIWVSTKHGVERWYSDYPFPVTGDFIGIQGAGARKIGLAAFNTMANNVPEPAATAHTLTPGIPNISIDSAYYYLSSVDYDGIDNTLQSGLEGDGTIQGFPALTAALQTHSLTPQNIKVRFTPVSLGDDIQGQGYDWTYGFSTEERKYQKRIEVYGDSASEIKSHYEILLNDIVLFKGEMPVVHLGIGYNKYGHLIDSIAAHTDDTRLIRSQFITQQNAIDVADAIEQDLNGHGVKFVFQSIQSANDTTLRTNERAGGLFKVNYSYLKKSDTVMALINPMAGIYRIGNSFRAHFPDFSTAVDSLQKHGVSSWVNFVVEDGIYNEQFSISPITGTLEWNNRPIRFRSLYNDSTKVTVQFSPANVANNFVFKHNGVKRLSFEKLHFKNISATYGRVIHINAHTQHFGLYNSVIENNAAALANIDNDLVFTSGSSSYGIFSKSVFKNGNRALQLSGDYIKITDNEFYGHKNYAVNFGSNTMNAEVSRNNIYGPETGTFSGISLGSASGKFRVMQNRIINTKVPGISGINASFSASGGSIASENGGVWNNEIAMLAAANTRGIVAQSAYTGFYHNTVHLTGNETESAAVQAGLSQGNTKIENNIFSNPNGFAMIVWRSASNYYPESNRNIYKGSANPFKIHTNNNVFTNYANIAALGAVTNRDAASTEADPHFLSDETLIPQNAAIYNLAPNIAAITTDIRNKPRPNNNRDHGAYEFNAWSGAFSSSWSQAANWTDAVVPDSNGMALFPSNGVTHELIITQPRSIHTISVAAGRNITINNNNELNIKGSLHNNGFIGGTGYVICNEGEQQHLSGTGSIRNLIINNSNGVSIAADNNNAIGIAETLDIQNGTLITNDNLVLKSSVATTARIKPLITGNISGKVTVERYIPAKRAWRALTAPVKGNINNSVFYNWQNNDSIIANYGAEIWSPLGTANPSNANNGLALGNSSSMLRFQNNAWHTITNTNTAELFNEQTNNSYLLFVTGSYENGNGNIVNGATATTLAAKGELITGTHTVDNLSTNQFHLIGNPYASSIDFSQLQRTNLQNRFWIWDPNRAGANNLGGYVLFDAATNTTVPATPVGSYNNYTNLIQSGQAFFVYAENGNGSLQFDEDAKTSNSNDMVFRTNAGGFEKMNVSLYRHINNTPQFSDGITALFDNNGDTAVNSQDAFKMFNGVDNIAFIRNGNSLMLERRPLIDDKDTLFVRISNTINATYELRLQAQDFDVAANLIAELIDNYTNTITPVILSAETVYTFSVNADAASKGDRFMIVFKQSNTLPLHTIVLKATQQQRTVQVQWQTTGEYDMDKYAVEKSTDGISFKEVYTTAAYNTNNEHSYNWIDAYPIVGTNYYRIKAINKDGSFVYSNIERVQFTTKNTFTVYPNPARKGETVNIQLQQTPQSKLVISLLNMEGKKVWESLLAVSQNNGFKINLPATLATGKYTIAIHDTNGNVQHQSIIIY